MRKKILYIFFVVLLLVNGALLYMLVQKPQIKGKSKDHFLTEQLQFNEDQEERFRFLDNEHRKQMRHIDAQMRDAKEKLFNSFSDTAFSPVAITERIGDLETKKEQELYAFFKLVRKLCDEEQAKKFDLIIKEALHKRGPKGKRDHKRPPPPR